MILIAEILIVYSSATTASRVKKSLSSSGYSAKVIQTPKDISSGGCSYSVATSRSAIEKARIISQKMGVNIKNIFLYNGNEYINY